MPWNIADYYLLDRIKRAESQIAYVVSRLGAVNITVTSGGGNNDLEGTNNPTTTPGILPPYPAQPGSYRQYNDEDTLIQEFFWHVATQSWV